MMNLTIEPWIPALRENGTRDLFSLSDLFANAHEIRDLAVKPHERIALMRLLLCITQAALDGPADSDAWETCEPQIQPSVRDYLAKWHCAFELFGKESRFLQLPMLQPGKDSDEGNPATKLDLALATGNNSTLFDNRAGEQRLLVYARAALNLLTFQCFSPGGRIGVARWNGKETPGKGSSNHAPCTPSSMIHTFILGSTLRQTLRLNLVTKDLIQDLPGNGWGKPIWEMPVAQIEDAPAVKNATQTYLGRLVPVSRAVRLNDDGVSIILSNGLDYPIFPAFREPTATIVKRKDDELGVLPASTGRSFWRQLHAVAVKRRAAADQISGPLSLCNLRDEQDTALWLGALVTDKAKIEDLVEASYSLPAGMLTDLGRMAYEGGVRYAEEIEGILIQAVKAYASELKVASPSYDAARQHFWTRIEQNLSALFAIAKQHTPPDQLPGSDWGRTAQQAARDAYEQVCPRQTPRQIQAFALGLRRLSFTPKTAKPARKKS
ncbi:MAG: type I-E CRISPR-associated protein Cse1/CasA [Verrucomicrobia bacterium]|nr:type I-E CRISPR-associated protein Cse1/CasA [Verrucomicrobiota bacterium]